MKKFRKEKEQKELLQNEQIGAEKGDIKAHIQRQQSKYGDIHTEFLFFEKQSEQSSYFSNQIKNYKSVIDEIAFGSHKKSEELGGLKLLLSELRTSQKVNIDSSNSQNNRLPRKSSINSVLGGSQDTQFRDSTQSRSVQQQYPFDSVIQRSSFTPSQSSPRQSIFSQFSEYFKFKKMENGSDSLHSTECQSTAQLHSSQVQVNQMKNKIQSVEMTLEELSEKIILEEQTQEFLSEMLKETIKSSDKQKAESNRIQLILNTLRANESRVNNKYQSFSTEANSISKELKRAQQYVGKETEYQQNKVQEKVNLFQSQNKILKESVKQIQRLRNDIEQQEKYQQKQLLKIEKLEEERQKKEFTKKDTQLFLKNLREIDLILKHFILGNPEELFWDKVDMNTQNFDQLFPLSSPNSIRSVQESQQPFQKLFCQRTSIVEAIKDSSHFDIVQDKQSPSNNITKNQHSNKKSRMFLLQTDIQIPKVQQNQVVEKVNQFLRYHSLAPQEIEDMLINSYNQLIITESTLQNRLSNLMDDREIHLALIKKLDQKIESFSKNASLSKLLQEYETRLQNNQSQGIIGERCEDNTINELIQREEDLKSNQMSIMNKLKSERFVSFIFYSLNELVFRWSSFVGSIINLSTSTYKEESRMFIEQVKRKKLFSKKIINLIRSFNNEFVLDQNENKSQIKIPTNPFTQREIKSQRDVVKSNNEINDTKSEIAFKTIPDQPQKIKQLNILSTLHKFQSQLEEQSQQNITEEEIQTIYNLIKNDFVVCNFLVEQELTEYLQRVYIKYEESKQAHPTSLYDKFSNYFIDDIADLKAKSDQNFKGSLMFLTDTLFSLLQDTKSEQEFLAQLIENQMLEIQMNKQKAQQQMLNNFGQQMNLVDSMQMSSQQNNNNNNIGTPFHLNHMPVPLSNSIMQKKLFRKRVVMMKCREFNDYYGFEVNRYQKNTAQTIIDVIYETLYDMKHGNSPEIYDQNQEIKFFLEKRSQTKSVDKIRELKEREEERKRDVEQKAKDKKNKTYLMKPAAFEFNEQQNKSITQFDKNLNKQLKENDKILTSQKEQGQKLSERQLRERRSEVIQKMRQTYSNFHTKYKPVSLNVVRDADSFSSENLINNLQNISLSKKADSQQRVRFSRSPTLHKSVKLCAVDSSISLSLQNREDYIEEKVKSPLLEKSVQFLEQKKEKQSIFKMGQNQTQSEMPDSPLLLDNKTAEKDNSFSQKFIPNELQKPTFRSNLKKLSSMMIMADKQQEEKIDQDLDHSSYFDYTIKDENEKESEHSISEFQIFSRNVSVSKREEDNTIRKKKNIQDILKLDLDKLKKEEKGKSSLNQVKVQRKPDHLFRHSLEKLINIPTPLGPLMLTKKEDLLLKRKNEKCNTQRNKISEQTKKEERFDNFLTSRNHYGNSYHHDYFALPYKMTPAKHNQSGDIKSLRESYLNFRQSKSTNNSIPISTFNLSRTYQQYKI